MEMVNCNLSERTKVKLKSRVPQRTLVREDTQVVLSTGNFAKITGSLEPEILKFTA